MAKSGKESKYLGVRRHVRARLRRSIGSVRAKDMGGGVEREVESYMELRISHVFLGHPLRPLGKRIQPLLFFTSTHPLQIFIRCK